MRSKVLLALFGLLLLSMVISSTLRLVAIADTPRINADSSKGMPNILSTPPVAPMANMPKPIIYRMKIEGAIGAVTDDRITDALDKCERDSAQLLVIILDTPGGFTRPTWSITKKILNSATPVCVYIAPSGARAGSAGVYITYSSHFAAMAFSTNIGAAHPVGGQGEEIDSIMNEKVTNDAAAQIKAFAEKRHRNATWAEAAVRQSVSITDHEALDSNVIDIRAKDYDDLISQIDGRETEVPAGNRKMALAGAETRDIELTFIQKLLEIITQPDVAFILFSIGGLGIVIELYNPGSIFPGIIGAICLILAFYSFQTLPINYAGVALILLAIVLFIVEIKVVSHGLLTAGGILALILGGMLLVDDADPSLHVSWSILITIAVLMGGTLIFVMLMALKASRRRVVTGETALIGKIGTVHKDQYVYVEGALWKYWSDENLDVDDRVEVIKTDQLTLKVKRITK
ncbi:MAG: nodulation protein NfeD [Candidatus Zixiibacteriota bacterium]